MNQRTRWLPAAALTLVAAATGQDAERATHTDDASIAQVSFSIDRPEFRLEQYQLGCLSLLSYVVISGGEAAVIDPQRDVQHYLDAVTAAGARLRHVLLTHPHADFVAGHTELAQRTGAEIAISRRAGAAFAHRALADGDAIAFGNVRLIMWETPGHTPNASTFVMRVTGGNEPLAAFTGDTLFIGGIGRPDLLDVPPAELAAQSFDSIARLKTLPDATLVLPAHGAGSLCGAHLSPGTTSTIGQEKRSNPYLQIASRATFVAKVISHQPVAPPYFRMNVALNLAGPPLIDRNQQLPPRTDPAQLAAAGEHWLVDLRDQQRYAAAHLRGAINVALRGRLDTWTGTVVPFDAPLYLIGNEAEVREGAFRLRRIGYDHVRGWLDDDAAAWRAAGLEVRASALLKPADLHSLMQRGEEPMIVDVRTADEYDDLRIGETGNIAVTDSARFGTQLSRTQPVVMLCNSAYRSSMAVGLAERLGFTQVGSLDGGLDAWLAAGLPVIGRMAAHGITLPASLTVAQLAGAKDVVLFDLRAAWEFTDWHVPAAQNVTPDAVQELVRALPAGRRAVLISRDGSEAYAVAGALLAREPGLPLIVLHGGAIAFYQQVVLRSDAAAAAVPATGMSPSIVPTTLPKKRSAGC